MREGPARVAHGLARSADGITAVIEHRRREPIFHTVDDLEIRRQLGVVD